MINVFLNIFRKKKPRPLHYYRLSYGDEIYQFVEILEEDLKRIEFLTSVGKKVEATKHIRSIRRLSLRDAKRIIDNICDGDEMILDRPKPEETGDE